MQVSFSRDYPQEAQSLSKARADVAQFATFCELESEQVSDIVLAVGEATGNIIEHSGSSHDFSLCCQFDGKRLIISIEDNGKGYTPGSVPPLQPEVGSRGLGIYLMNRLMDKVEISRKPGDGAIVRLEKKALIVPP
jgi:serine/threonine-protein kinase RsbW